MKNLLNVLTLTYCCVFSSWAFAKTTYGTIDSQKIMASIEEAKTAKANLEKEAKEAEAKILKQQQALQKLQEDLKNKIALMTPEAKMREQENFQKQVMKFEQDKMSFTRQLKQKEAIATQEILGKISKIASQIANERDIDQVWDKNTPGLMYIKAKDMTAEVIRIYEESTLKKLSKAKKNQGGTNAAANRG